MSLYFSDDDERDASTYLGAHFKKDKTKRVSVTDVLFNANNDALVQKDGCMYSKYPPMSERTHRLSLT